MEADMPKIMKSLNIISRCQATYRGAKLSELPACYHTFVLAICRESGRSQEELSRDIKVNKSTTTRALSYLEEKGYITRTPNPQDKRELLIYPTEKMSAILSEVKSITTDWHYLISRGISDAEMEIFESVIARMEKSARQAVDELEEEIR